MQLWWDLHSSVPSSTETQTSQSSSRVIGTNIFTSKHTPTQFHHYSREAAEYLSASQTWGHFQCSSLASPGSRRRSLRRIKPFIWALGWSCPPCCWHQLSYTPTKSPLMELNQENLSYRTISPSSWVFRVGCWTSNTSTSMWVWHMHKAAVLLCYSTFTIVRNAGPT